MQKKHLLDGTFKVADTDKERGADFPCTRIDHMDFASSHSPSDEWRGRIHVYGYNEQESHDMACELVHVLGKLQKAMEPSQRERAYAHASTLGERLKNLGEAAAQLLEAAGIEVSEEPVKRDSSKFYWKPPSRNSGSVDGYHHRADALAGALRWLGAMLKERKLFDSQGGLNVPTFDLSSMRDELESITARARHQERMLIEEQKARESIAAENDRLEGELRDRIAAWTDEREGYEQQIAELKQQRSYIHASTLGRSSDRVDDTTRSLEANELRSLPRLHDQSTLNELAYGTSDVYLSKKLWRIAEEGGLDPLQSALVAAASDRLGINVFPTMEQLKQRPMSKMELIEHLYPSDRGYSVDPALPQAWVDHMREALGAQYVEEFEAGCGGIASHFASVYPGYGDMTVMPLTRPGIGLLARAVTLL